MANYVRKLMQIALITATITASSHVFAEATVPTSDVEGASDSSLLKRYEGSFIVSYEKFAYTDFVVPLSPLKRSADEAERDQNNNKVFRPEKQVELEGALTRIVYVLPDQRSPLEVLRNYEDVVRQSGGEVEYECKHEECGGDPRKASGGGGGSMSLVQFFVYESQIKDKLFSNGRCALTSRIDDQRYFSARLPQANGDAYATVHTFANVDNRPDCRALNGRTIALVHVLEPKAREQKMVVVEAAEMAKSLTTQGSISLYGIHFDFDKSDIKPESRPAMDEISKLLEADPTLNILIVGHTDGTGTHEYNIELSSRRAQAVMDELVSAYGISDKRLAAAGAGMMAPVATNDTEEGRAKNRRVELVKRN
jgi:OmpA-OmpF porin, OOP family